MWTKSQLKHFHFITGRNSVSSRAFNSTFKVHWAWQLKLENSLNVPTIKQSMKQDERRLSQRDLFSREPRHTFALIALFNRHLDAPLDSGDGLSEAPCLRGTNWHKSKRELSGCQIFEFQAHVCEVAWHQWGKRKKKSKSIWTTQHFITIIFFVQVWVIKLYHWLLVSHSYLWNAKTSISRTLTLSFLCTPRPRMQRHTPTPTLGLP